jgi:hypothetical protein
MFVACMGLESSFLGWEWGFWGKTAINSKSFEKFAIIRKISEKVLQGACKRLKKSQKTHKKLHKIELW